MTTTVGFFDLAAELRNRTYRLVLIKYDPITPQSRKDRAREKPSLALLKTCRQVCEEASTMYLLENTYRFYNNDAFVRRFPKFLSVVEIEYRRRLKSIVLEGHITPGVHCKCKECGKAAPVTLDLQSMKVTFNDHWSDDIKKLEPFQTLVKRLEWDFVEWKGSGLRAVSGFAEDVEATLHEHYRELGMRSYLRRHLPNDSL